MGESWESQGVPDARSQIVGTLSPKLGHRVPPDRWKPFGLDTGPAAALPIRESVTPRSSQPHGRLVTTLAFGDLALPSRKEFQQLLAMQLAEVSA